jgi:poly(3-hydroxybutyrate) depolymerase
MVRRITIATPLVLAACYVGAGDAASTSGGATSGADDDGGTTAPIVDAESSSDAAPSRDEADAGSIVDGSDGESSAAATDDSSTGVSGSGCDAPMIAGSTTEILDVDGLERTYLAVVPESVDGLTAPVPVVMGFHGSNGTAEIASETYGLTGIAPAIYVYPQALFSAEKGGTSWDVDPLGPDIPYFDAMLVDLAQKFCIDDARIFAAGQSNGAFFVHELGCRRADVLRAIAPVAGGGPSWHPDCTQTETVMMVHGVADTTVPIETGINSREFWRGMNDCAEAASVPVNPDPCIAYIGCDEPVLWCQHPGDHEWPDFAGPAIRGFFLAL